MVSISRILKSIVAATLLLPAAAAAQDDADPLDDLFVALRDAEGPAVHAIEGKIVQEWSKSGSPSMDLLLERGREAMAQEDWSRAIEHFSALIDHAPAFAEGWNARATAYFQAGRFGPALRDIERTLALNPRHFGALSGLGVIMEDLGHEELALQAWQAVAELSPNREELDETLTRLERKALGQTL
jgi:Flp pilus assembly protein TadD